MLAPAIHTLEYRQATEMSAVILSLYLYPSLALPDYMQTTKLHAPYIHLFMEVNADRHSQT